MRVVGYAFVALAFGTITSGPTAAQCYGPECEGSRSGPPRYYTDRPAYDGRRESFDWPANDPRQGFDRPQYRGDPDDNGSRYDRTGDSGPRPGPAASDPRERRTDPPYRRVGPATPSENDRRFGDDRSDRPARPTANWPTAPRDAAPSQRFSKPAMVPQAPRTAAGPGTVTISVAEYHALQDQARELQRLLDRRNEFRDGPRGDFRDRDMRPGGGVIYR